MRSSATTFASALLLFASVSAQGDSPVGGDDVLDRGLLATHLNKHPTGGQTSGQLQGRVSQNRYCCCSSGRSFCPRSGGSGGFADFINPRDSLTTTDEETDPRSGGNLEADIGVRIVNNPPTTGGQTSGRCRVNQRECCYSKYSELQRVSRTCTPIGASGEGWQQECKENVPRRGNQCGTRHPSERVRVQGAQAKPNEFPWTCLVLKGKNDFVGTCAIVPSNRNNDISRGTDRVITAAHKLKNVRPNDELKVRVQEYDASGFRRPETAIHQEYVVSRIRTHPRYDSRRLSHDLAVLHLVNNINLRSSVGVNAACYPACSDMFDHKFENGTGTRCWVAGWGKKGDGPSESFQTIQNKVDVPLFDRSKCTRAIRTALGRKRAPGANNFALSRSEICAGGEEGKDACDGDGGAPLVCQATSGRWHVVGLVTWGVGCADRNVPGVYADIYNMLSFITGR